MTRKPKGVKITSYTEPVEQPSPIDERHRHTSYVTGRGLHLRTSRSIVTTQPSSDVPSSPPAEPPTSEGNFPSDFDPNGSGFPFPWMDQTHFDDPNEEPEARKRTRTLAVVRMVSYILLYITNVALQTNPLLLWATHERDMYLSELLRLEGRGDFAGKSTCGQCGSNDSPSFHRCEDCQDSNLYCGACMVKLHCSLPFHRVKVFFC